ncbi:MAG: fibronectin type III domain-containing protein [Candidatus Nanopelagicales bacterium]|nr:fibronectin type III domain-containing protein [Candidatus Nanopelagicales bacterium]
MKAEAGNNSVTLTWDEPTNPVPLSYYVNVTPDDRILNITAPISSMVISGLKNGVEYSFQLYSATELGTSAPAAIVKATPTTGTEGEVAGLIVGFAPQIAIADHQGDVPGEERVTQVGLSVDSKISEGVHTVDFTEAVSLPEAKVIAAELQGDPKVAWAEPDQFVYTSSVTPAPNDEQYATNQWNLWDTYGVGLGNNNTTMSRAYTPTAGTGTVVAVIDTGITSHPDLDGSLVPGYDFVSNPETLAAQRMPGGNDEPFDADSADPSSYGPLGWDANPADPGDWRSVSPSRYSTWHGTHIAGVIAAAANNAQGVVGVVPGAKIQPIRALSWRGGLMSDIAASITWASGGHVDGVPDNQTPANVINMSFAVNSTCSVALQSAIDGAYARGSVLVAAAGNANDDVANYAPANCNHVIAVGATEREGQRAQYSNFGSGIDISAPGGSGTSAGGVTSTVNLGAAAPAGPGYGAQEGTSVAAAHVSSAVAYLKALNPTATPSEITRTITGRNAVRAFSATTCDPDPTKTCGPGILNFAQIASAGTPGVDVAVTVGGNLVADGSTIGVGSTIGLGTSGLLSPGTGSRTLRTVLHTGTVYQSGSAVAPEGWAVQYSTDGTNWVSSEPSPASGVKQVKATATVSAGLIDGNSQIYSTETSASVPSSTFTASTGGDGWDVFFSDNYVFNIFHHSDAIVLDCHLKTTGARCAGYTKTFNGYRASMRSGGWVDSTTGKLYAFTSSTSTNRPGVLCIDITVAGVAPTSCGFITLSTTISSSNYNYLTEAESVGRRIFGVATDGTNGQLVCFDAVTNAQCVGTPINIDGAGYAQESTANVRPLKVGDKIVVKTSTRVYCYIAATMAQCSGSWPATINSGTKTPLAPHTTSSGSLDGVCYENGCVNLSGVVQAGWTTPFTLGYSNWAMHAVVGTLSGTRYMWAAEPLTVRCFDYATNAACSGAFPKDFSGYNLLYSIRVDPENESCLWVNSDAGRISNFDALTGNNGCTSNPVITLQPSQFAPRYVCSTNVGITQWNELRLVSLAGGGTASTVRLTVRDATGAVVTGWSNKPFTITPGATPLGTLDMTGLDVALSGSRPTFSFAFSGITGSITTAVIALDYKGKGPELCVNTTATAPSPPLAALVTGYLTETVGVSETFMATRSFTIGSSAAIVTQTVPTAPRGMSGTGLNTSATVRFQAPASDGGTPITGYQISLDGGSSWTDASVVDNGDGTYSSSLTGLTAGTTYDIRAAAVNAIGRGATASISVTAQLLSISTLLDTPINQGPILLAATTGGGLPLTYTSSTSAVCTVSVRTVTLVTQGVCNLVAYQAGDATASPVILPATTPGSFTVLPPYYTPTVPGVPTSVVLTPGNTQVSMAWIAPVDDGHSTITDYSIQYKSGSSWIPFIDGVSTNTSVIVTGLTNGTLYSFRVAAVNAIGTGTYTSTSTSTPATIPGAPTSLSASRSSTNGTLTWTAPASDGGSAVTDYLVAYKLSTDADWTVFNDGVRTATGATVTGLTTGANYDFQVITVNLVGSSSATSTVNLTATPSAGQVALAWNAPASPGGTIADYEMQYRVSGDSTWVTFTDAIGTATGGTVSGLTNGTAYNFRVATILTTTVVSSYTSVVTSTPRTSPSVVTDLAAAPGNRQIALTWTAPIDGGSAITDYAIQFKASADASWTTFTDPVIGTTGATVTGLLNATSYDFRVATTNVVGTSGYSSAVSGTPRTTPGVPTSITATPTSGQVSLSWTAPSSNGGSPITDYVIELKTASAFTWTTIADGLNTSTSLVVTGLANDTAYNFRIAAANSAGQGSYATPVASTPFGPISAPRSLVATAPSTSLILNWLAPLSSGASAISDYLIQYRVSGASAWTTWSHSASTATSATITGLTGLASGTVYEARVAAVNATDTSSYASVTYPLVSPSGTGGGTTPVTSTTQPIALPTDLPSITPITPPVIPSNAKGVLLVGGVPVSMNISAPTSTSAPWRVSGLDFNMSFLPRTSDSSTSTSSSTPSQNPANPSLSAGPGGWIKIEGDGNMPSSTVKAFLVPSSMAARMSYRVSQTISYLGEVDVTKIGSFDITVNIPNDAEPGEYVLQINGVNLKAQVRSVNMAISITGAPLVLAPRSAKKTKFFTSGKSTLTSYGRVRLLSIARSIPRNATNVQLSITGASGGLKSMDANYRLAMRRAKVLIGFLKERGVSGTYTLTLKTSLGFGGESGANSQVSRLPLSVVNASFKAPSVAKK